MTEMTFALFIL